MRVPPAHLLPVDLPLPRRDAVFTTALVAGGRVRHWDRHRARLQRSSAALFGADLPADLDERVAAALGEGPARLRVQLTGRSAAVAVEPADVAPRPPLRLATVGGRTGDWDHKWCDRTQLEAAEALVGPGRVPLFVTADGHVLETSRANVVVVEPGRLLVPPPSADALPGVTLSVLLERAGLPVEQVPLTVDDLAGRVVVVASSIAGVTPVADVDGRACAVDEVLLERLRALLG